ncbi:MAG: hypothetical protein ABI321_00345 [Polyangia bacterium]
MRLLAPLVCLFLCACGGNDKAAVVQDLAVHVGADLASNGHLGDACSDDEQCLSKHCVTVSEWPSGPFHICGQRCDATDAGTSCVEGSCGSTLYGRWCLSTCTAQSTCASKIYCCTSVDELCHPANDCEI